MIDKRTLEYILTDQQEELEEKAQDELCQRKEAVLVDTKSTQAQVVIGVRRSGKSTICYQALQNAGVKYAYADFDDERLDGLTAKQLNDVLETLYKIYGDFNYLFLDEIQNVKGWHLFVNRMLRKKMHIVITQGIIVFRSVIQVAEFQQIDMLHLGADWREKEDEKHHYRNH